MADQLWSTQLERTLTIETATLNPRRAGESAYHYAARLAALAGLLGSGRQLSDGSTLTVNEYACNVPGCLTCASVNDPGSTNAVRLDPL